MSQCRIEPAWLLLRRKIERQSRSGSIKAGSSECKDRRGAVRFNLEAKRRESHATQFEDEQHSILNVGLDPFFGGYLMVRAAKRPAPQPFLSFASLVCREQQR
jgi:hypothetical protein